MDRIERLKAALANQSDDRLYAIAYESEGEYSEESILIARDLLHERVEDLSGIEDVKKSFEARKRAEMDRNQRRANARAKVSKSVNEIVDNFDPSNSPSSTIVIRVLCVFLMLNAFSLAYKAYHGFRLIKYGMMPTEGVLYIITLVVLLLCAYYLYRERSIGWKIAVVYFTQLAISSVLIFVSTFLLYIKYGRRDVDASQNDIVTFIDSNFLDYSGMIMSALALIVISISVTWYLCKLDIRQKYRVAKRDMRSMLIAGIILAFFMEYLLDIFMYMGK